MLALATLGLVGVGGLVTSHGVGMAVPDWPNTYGYNMFFFPISRWVGGVFYEHSHRLVASAVGFLTLILGLWLYGRKARPFMRWSGFALLAAAGLAWVAAPQRWADALVLGVTGLLASGASFFWPRAEPAPAWLRRLGLLACFAVVLQGVLGGLRVTAAKDELGIFHATLAQLFFALVCSIALFTSRWWAAWNSSAPAAPRPAVPRPLARLLLGTTLLILLQLILGATMRHQHAGLAIPDFPLAYGRLWPATDPASVEHYNAQRMEVLAANPITSAQVVLQMVHRLVALLILAGVFASVRSLRRTLGGRNFFSAAALFWLSLILAQIVLGAATIWSNKAADIATLHVMVGAVSLATGAILCIISIRVPAPARERLSGANKAGEGFPSVAFEPGRAAAGGGARQG